MDCGAGGAGGDAGGVTPQTGGLKKPRSACNKQFCVDARKTAREKIGALEATVKDLQKNMLISHQTSTLSSASYKLLRMVVASTLTPKALSRRDGARGPMSHGTGCNPVSRWCWRVATR